MRCTRAAGPLGRISHTVEETAGRGAAGRELQFNFRTGFSRFRRNCSALVVCPFFRNPIAISAF
jgi:hypothetical protein